jgi:hypothetical protein
MTVDRGTRLRLLRRSVRVRERHPSEGVVGVGTTREDTKPGMVLYSARQRSLAGCVG